MNVFETQKEATEYADKKYNDYISTGVANVVFAGPTIAKMIGCNVGYYIDIEREG